MIQVFCGSCGGQYEAADESAGRSDFCPICGDLNDIPPIETDLVESDLEPADIQIPYEADASISPEVEANSSPTTEADAASAAEETSQSEVVPESALAEIAEIEARALETQSTEPLELEPAVAPSRGIPAVIWWGLLIMGITAFVGVCVYLMSDTWENQHVMSLTDTVKHADALMTEEDFSAAATQYRSVIDTVGQRKVESLFIRQLVDHAKKGESDATSRMHSAVR
jgi:hypothetical protein